MPKTPRLDPPMTLHHKVKVGASVPYLIGLNVIGQICMLSYIQIRSHEHDILILSHDNTLYCRFFVLAVMRSVKSL